MIANKIGWGKKVNEEYCHGAPTVQLMDFFIFLKFWICSLQQSSSISSSRFSSSFSLSADVFARSSSDWGRQTDQHALAVFCLCNNTSVTMKPHSTCLPLCVLKASIWVICTNKVINLSLYFSFVFVCVLRMWLNVWGTERGKRSLSFLFGRGISYAYAGVFSCMWAVDMIRSSGVWWTA